MAVRGHGQSAGCARREAFVHLEGNGPCGTRARCRTALRVVFAALSEWAKGKTWCHFDSEGRLGKCGRRAPAGVCEREGKWLVRHARRGPHSAGRFCWLAVCGAERQDVVAFWLCGAAARVPQALAGFCLCARPQGSALPGVRQGCQGNGSSRWEGRTACAWWAIVHSGPPPPCGQVVGERLFRVASSTGLGGFCPRHGETLVGVGTSAKRCPSGQRCGVFLTW